MIVTLSTEQLGSWNGWDERINVLSVSKDNRI